jgi:autotransporter-associated beta strand protein
MRRDERIQSESPIKGSQSTLRRLLASTEVCVPASVIGIALGSLALSNVDGAITNFSLTTSTYGQTFDGMGVIPPSPVPQGWGFGTGNPTTPASATTVANAAAGSTGAGVLTGTSGGNAYVFVNGERDTGTDKAIGLLTSGSFVSPRSIIFGFTNNTGSTVSTLTLDWNYEKYRSGIRAFDWTFFGSDTGTTYTAVVDGNQSYAANPNNTTIFNPPQQVSANGASPVTISGLNIPDGGSYYLQWVYTGVGGSTNGQALAIDDFSLTATLVAPAKTLTWTPDPGETNWNTNAGNLNWLDETPAASAFTNGDTVNFTDDGLANGSTVNVDAGGVTPANINVSNTTGVYTIGGGAIGGTGSLVKTGAGVLTLGGSNTYGGTTTVNAGTLRLTGTHSGGGAYTIGDGTNAALLTGNGSTDAPVTIGNAAVIAPGNSTGAIGTGDLTIESGGTYIAEIDWNFSLNAQPSADQIDVTGTVTLDAGAVLQFAMIEALAGAVSPQRTVVLIRNDGSDDVVGEFAGLPEGGPHVFDLLVSFTIDYHYDADTNTPDIGNDVAITFASVPEPSGALLLLGLGVLPRRRARGR